MRWLLLPEACDWAPEVMHRLPLAPKDCVFAPWALPQPAPRWLSRGLQAAWSRRSHAVPPGVQHLALPGWSVLEGASRHASRDTARRVRSRFALRHLLSRVAAQRLPEGVKTVIAPSLAARELFAAARARGARCILVEDLPSLRALHADLDRAALRHPGAAFLRNHRASAADVARQEAERVLADELWVRSPFTEAVLLDAGHAPARICALSPHPAVPGLRAPSGRTLLLAGGATARAGIFEVLAALDARPQWTLQVRESEGAEPAARRHPRVRFVARGAGLRGVAAVLAPAWAEQHAEEVLAAEREGVPLIASDRAAGWSPCARVPAGDTESLLRALDGLERTEGPSDYSL